MSGSNEASPPSAPYGSAERRNYWNTYWKQWGDSNESHRVVAGQIQDLEQDDTRLEELAANYEYRYAETKEQRYREMAAVFRREAAILVTRIQEYDRQLTDALKKSGPGYKP